MASLPLAYPRLGLAALSFLRRPSGPFGTWSQAATGFSGAAARYLGSAPGTAQQEGVPTFAQVPAATTHTLLCGQFLSDPLRAQTLAAGSWRVAFCARLQNAGVGYRWSGQAALYLVNGLTGERRASVFNVTRIGSFNRTSTLERTCLASVTGFEVRAFTGDYLSLELGIEVVNAFAGAVPQASLYADGVLAISGDDVQQNDGRATLAPPQELLLSLPQPGEAPGARVSHAEAVLLIKEHFPPHSDLLYDWDAPAAFITQLLAFLGDVLKLYGYDVADRLLREVSPLTCIELLPYWEAALGIIYTQGAGQLGPEQRRQAVLAALRTIGPLTPFNLLAALAALVGYDPGTTPELLEFDKTDMTGVPIFTETIATNGDIPELVDWDPGALVRWSPVLLDGGFTWATGAAVYITLSGATSSECRFRLEAPNYQLATWEGGPDRTDLILRSPVFAGGPAHGSWRLYAFRVMGSTPVAISAWSLVTLGAGKGGRGQHKGDWSVYFDAAHQGYDLRALRALLDKVTQSYGQSWIINAKTSLPGTNLHRPGQFVPGS